MRTQTSNAAVSAASAVGPGVVGALALTLIHESMKRVVPDAPRMDVLGERAIARTMRAFGKRPPREDKLYRAALAGDLITNSAFYALVGRGPGAWLRGIFLGTLAGVGAVVLPPILGLGRWPAESTRSKKFLTCSFYIAGGLTAAATSRAISGARARHL